MSFEINVKENILAIQQIQNLDKQFYLHSPNKGKILRGSNFNAYNRKSLGTIPRNVEKIIFKNKSFDLPKGFNSRCDRFGQQYDRIKYSYPAPGQNERTGNLRNNNLQDSILSPLLKHGNGFLSECTRFDDRVEFSQRYSPGPGFYQVENNKLKMSPLRYQSLYNAKENYSLKKYNINPGPGHYNPLHSSLLMKDPNINKLHSFFQSEILRFPEDKELLENAKLGPGTYFKSQELVKYPQKESFFFKNNNFNAKDGSINKYLETNKNKNYLAEEPNKCQLPRIEEMKWNGNFRQQQIISERKNNFSTKLIKSHCNNQLFCSDIKMEKNHENELFQGLWLNDLMTPVETHQKGICSPFVSKSPREHYLGKNHIPGPCYYHPQISPRRENFNKNQNKVWL